MNKDEINSKNLQQNYTNLIKKERHLLNEKIIFQHFFERESKNEYNLARERFEDYFSERLRRLRDIPVLDNAQKYDVVRNELQHVNNKWEMFEKRKDEKVDRLLAMNQEIVQSMKEIKIEVIELNRKIDIKSNAKDGKISAELFHKFYDEKFKKLQNTKKKLEEQNENLIRQITSISKKIDSKDKNNDLQFIDFHQLQIENKKYLKEVDEKNKMLLKQKMTIGKISQDKNKMKDKLNLEIQNLKNISDEIVDKDNKICKIEKMIQKQEKKKKKDEELTQQLDRKQHKSNFIITVNLFLLNLI
jgi:hypothetical protein